MINYTKRRLNKTKRRNKRKNSKVIDKTKIIIKKIIYEDGSEDEVEDVGYTQPGTLATYPQKSAIWLVPSFPVLLYLEKY